MASLYSLGLSLLLKFMFALRTCSQSSEQKSQERQVNELQAGVEPSLMVLREPAVLLQPRKAALHHPALGHDPEAVQFAALGNLHCHLFTQRLTHPQCKRLSRVAPIGEHAFDLLQPCLAPLEGLQDSLAIRHIRRRYRYSMRQPLGIHRQVAFDPRDLLARVIALAARCVRVLHALRVADQELA